TTAPSQTTSPPPTPQPSKPSSPNLPPISANTLVASAVTAYENQKFTQALEYLRKAQTQDPERILYPGHNLHNLKGACYVGLRLFNHARTEFQAAAKAQADDFDPLFNLAELDFLQGQYPAAAEAFSKLQPLEKGRLYYDFLQYKIALCHLLNDDDKGFQAHLETQLPQSANELFLTLADTLKRNESEQAEVLMTAIREKIDPRTFSLYQDSLIEGGLLDPTNPKHDSSSPTLGTPERVPLTAAHSPSLPTGGTPPQPKPASPTDASPPSNSNRNSNANPSPKTQAPSINTTSPPLTPPATQPATPAKPINPSTNQPTNPKTASP
ncbi:MAG: hypothetical protein AAGD22_16360, partial [Verrucomicrobiota bacterium]